MRGANLLWPGRGLQVVAKYLWSHMTPWLRKDVDFVTHIEDTFQQSPFVALHIRRGDKITQHEAQEIDVEVRQELR